MAGGEDLNRVKRTTTAWIRASALARPLIAALIIALVGASSLVPAVAFAQATPSAAAEASSRSSGGPRKQLATIVYAGLGGAVLGLSTLSFYGRPQEKLANIAIGFAFGIIVGTTYVTYKAASNPSEFYGLRPQLERDFELASRAGAASSGLTVASWAWEF